MTDANAAIQPVHQRMPVLLHPDEFEHWLHGSFGQALAIQKRTFPPELIVVDRTDELWAGKKPGCENLTLL